PKLLMNDGDASFQDAFSREMQQYNVSIRVVDLYSFESLAFIKALKKRIAILTYKVQYAIERRLTDGKRSRIFKRILKKYIDYLNNTVRYLLKAGELEEDHRYRATDPYWNLYVFKIKRVVIGRNPSQPVLYYLENKPIESTAHLIRQNPKKPFKYEKLQDVRKSMSETVSTGQLGYEPILNIFWPELTRDMVSINANKKSQT
ncbi:17682_t:CDS:2, partial [Funneliformis geosporum]